MYYDHLKRAAQAYKNRKELQAENAVRIEDCIAPHYMPIHEDIIAGKHEFYNLPGGRGSGKSSFAALEIINGMMLDQDANAIVFRRIAGTLRESVFYQMQWAIDALGAGSMWRATFAPLTFTFIPTGQQILFRGLDDPAKLKSIKPRHGIFRYVWFEEFSELPGENMVRNVLQSVMRGGDHFKVFNTFNPPISCNAWANKYIELPNANALTFKTNYLQMPPEWLGEAFIAEAERLKAVNYKAYQHEYLAIPTGTGGEVFPNLEIRKLEDQEVQEVSYVFAGIDWGFSVDPAVFIRAGYDARTDTITLLDEIYRKHCSNALLAQLIKEQGFDKMAAGFLDDNQTIFADSAEPKSIHDLQEEGIAVRACRKYPGSVLYGIKWLQARKIIIDPERTPNAYREFVGYEYCTTKDGEFIADVPDRDNHTIDALRYAFTRLINTRTISA